MAKKSSQEMCPETASFWTKLHNEPYLRTHRRMFAVSLIWTFFTTLLWFPFVLLAAWYLRVSLDLFRLL